MCKRRLRKKLLKSSIQLSGAYKKNVKQIAEGLTQLQNGGKLFDHEYMAKGEPMKAEGKVPKVQGIPFMNKGGQMIFAAAVAMLQEFLRVNLRENIAIDVGLDETLLMTRLVKIFSQQNPNFNLELDLEQQDSTHSDKHIAIFAWFMELAGVPDFIIDLVVEARIKHHIKTQTPAFSMDSGLALGTGDPWTLIANILMMLSSVAMDFVWPKKFGMAQKGDDLTGHGKFLLKPMDQRYFKGVIYKIDVGKPLPTFCSKAFAGVVIRKLSRKLAKMLSVRNNDERLKDQHFNWQILYKEIMAVGPEAYADALQLAMPKTDARVLTELYVQTFEQLCKMKLLIPNFYKATHEIVNARDLCVFQSLMLVAPNHHKNSYFARPNVPISDLTAFADRERIQYKLIKGRYEKKGLKRMLLDDLFFKGLIIWEDHVVGVKPKRAIIGKQVVLRVKTELNVLQVY